MTGAQPRRFIRLPPVTKYGERIADVSLVGAAINVTQSRVIGALGPTRAYPQIGVIKRPCRRHRFLPFRPAFRRARHVCRAWERPRPPGSARFRPENG